MAELKSTWAKQQAAEEAAAMARLAAHKQLDADVRRHNEERQRQLDEAAKAERCGGCKSLHLVA